MIGRAIEIRVCLKNKLKNAFLTVAAGDVPEAKRIAKAWEKMKKESQQREPFSTGKFPFQKRRLR